MRINPNGSLELQGQDLGKLVLELRGNSDYEYGLHIESGQKDLLKKRLVAKYPEIKSDGDLLQWFKQNYSRNEAFSKIVELLQEMDIRYDASYW